MRNLKNKFIVTLCSLGLLLGVNGMVGSAYADTKPNRIKKEGFIIQSGQLSYKHKEFYTVEVWSEENKEEKPGYPYDGDTDISFDYYPNHDFNVYYKQWWNIEKYDKNRDGWVKNTCKWKERGDGSLESSYNTGSVLSDASYEEVPGSPKGLPTNMVFVEIKVDFDEGEEYAKGTFTNQEDALKWADNMIKIFKSGGKKF